MELNITKYELMKKVHGLDRSDKEQLLDEWDDIFKTIESSIEIESQFQKKASLNDPETADNIIEIMDLLEKFLKNDDNISHKNVCLFIIPMINGSRKITLRPYRVVGLVKKLRSLSRQFEREFNKSKKITPELREVKQGFFDVMTEIRNRLTSLDNEFVTKKKPKEKAPEFSNDRNLEKKLKLKLKKASIEKANTVKKTLAEMLDNHSQKLKDFQPKVAEKIIEQTTYGNGVSDAEIKKQILEKIRQCSQHHPTANMLKVR